MKNRKQAFSLIEIVIATGILTISVFGVYKLIGENSKIIGSSNNTLQAYSLIPSLQECIEYLGFDNLYATPITEYSFNFGPDLQSCATGSINQIIIDNIEYELNGRIMNSSTEQIRWELGIESDQTKKITQTYIQEKKN